MPETDYADPGADEARFIAKAHAAVLEQTRKNEFDAAPYERATDLLELLPAATFVDDRVRLALDITLATRTDYRPDLSRRALYAAFPSGGELKDPCLKRKWFTFTGILEAASGNVERAIRFKLVALELCEQLKDSYGFQVEWMGFANSASGAGLYEDAVRYATIAVETKLGTETPLLGRGMVLINRANALMRLGRFAEAEADVSASLMSITHPPDASVRNQVILCQYMFADLRLESGDLATARNALEAASTWADACGVPQYKLQLERVWARLSAFEADVEQAVSKLQELLKQALELEAKFGQTSLDDTVLDVLHTLERVHREHGDLDGANNWLTAIGERLRTNAMKMLDALAGKPLLADERSVAAKMAEVDRYLQSRATAQLGTLETASPSWNYLIGLAASASGVEDSTKEHGVRVARLAGTVARELGLSKAMQRGIEAGCLVHDVGKISIPSSILAKQTPLDERETQLFRAHPDIGTELFERVKLPDQSVVRNVIRFHHHAYEGGTTPSVVKGEAIPLEARIASVCDRYDALVAGRPRRPAISSADALRELFELRSRDFDPNLVDVVIDVVRRLQRTHLDLQAYLSEEADTMEYFAMQRTLKRAAARAGERLSPSRT
jgi:HD-GYP domain-containing protein (c-di-GMP phosphodiesterase class II)